MAHPSLTSDDQVCEQAHKRPPKPAPRSSPLPSELLSKLDSVESLVLLS